MPMGRGARIIRTAGRIAVSIRFSNVRRHGGETAGSATATLGQGIAPHDEAGVESPQEGVSYGLRRKFNLDQKARLSGWLFWRYGR